ncbi:MAG: ATP-binding cassette domain-containing protein, partial [Symploca sp. SIO2G7]|nr:ATP-binding cassette domain-containing protein [Symploca sp. SIO2G7]
MAHRVSSPTVLQMEAVECGAAALSMVLGYYGRYVPLAELRHACGVSRDGVTAANVLKAARTYGLEAKGFKKSLESLKQLKPPFIVFWHFNHFLVVDGFESKQVSLNDPATGPRRVTMQEFDEGYTGIALTFKPTQQFQPGGRKPTIVGSLGRRLSGSVGALLYCTLAGFLLVLPTLALPAFSRVYIDNILLAKRLDWLPYVLLGIALIVLVQGILTMFQLRYLRALRIKLAVGMASRFVWHVLQLPVGFYAQRFAGEISSRISLNDSVAAVLSGRLTTTIISSVMIVFYAIAMFQYDIPLTLIVISFAAINVGVLQWVSRQRKDANLRLVQEYGKASGVAVAGLQGMETLKAGGLESDFFARWIGYHTKAVNAQQNLGLANRVIGLLPALLSTLATLSLLIIGGLRIINGSLTIGMLVAFQLLMQSFQGPVNALVQFAGTLQTLQGNLDRLDDVLENETDIAFCSHCKQNVSEAEEAARHHRLSGAMEIRNLSFGYSPLDAPLIENFNLTIKPGQRVALVGGSGSGKSTLARVIAGLYQPSSGEVCFDGRSRQQISQATLTNSIAMVEQDILLFAGSVRDNLTLWDD